MTAVYEFERLIHCYLRETGVGERFSLDAHCEPPLCAAFARDFNTADAPLQAVSRALAFAAALDESFGSPTAAALIRRVVGSDPAAAELIKVRLLRTRTVDMHRAFARSEGREVAMEAPTYDAPPPGETVRLANINPCQGRCPIHIRQAERRDQHGRNNRS